MKSSEYIADSLRETLARNENYFFTRLIEDRNGVLTEVTVQRQEDLLEHPIEEHFVVDKTGMDAQDLLQIALNRVGPHGRVRVGFLRKLMGGPEFRKVYFTHKDCDFRGVSALEAETFMRKTPWANASGVELHLSFWPWRQRAEKDNPLFNMDKPENYGEKLFYEGPSVKVSDIDQVWVDRPREFILEMAERLLESPYITSLKPPRWGPQAPDMHTPPLLQFEPVLSSAFWQEQFQELLKSRKRGHLFARASLSHNPMRNDFDTLIREFPRVGHPGGRHLGNFTNELHYRVCEEFCKAPEDYTGYWGGYRHQDRPKDVDWFAMEQLVEGAMLAGVKLYLANPRYQCLIPLWVKDSLRLKEAVKMSTDSIRKMPGYAAAKGEPFTVARSIADRQFYVWTDTARWVATTAPLKELRRRMRWKAVKKKTNAVVRPSAETKRRELRWVEEGLMLFHALSQAVLYGIPGFQSLRAYGKRNRFFNLGWTAPTLVNIQRNYSEADREQKRAFKSDQLLIFYQCTRLTRTFEYCRLFRPFAADYTKFIRNLKTFYEAQHCQNREFPLYGVPLYNGAPDGGGHLVYAAETQGYTYRPLYHGDQTLPIWDGILFRYAWMMRALYGDDTAHMFRLYAAAREDAFGHEPVVYTKAHKAVTRIMEEAGARRGLFLGGCLSGDFRQPHHQKFDPYNFKFTFKETVSVRIAAKRIVEALQFIDLIHLNLNPKLW